MFHLVFIARTYNENKLYLPIPFSKPPFASSTVQVTIYMDRFRGFFTVLAISTVSTLLSVYARKPFGSTSYQKLIDYILSTVLFLAFPSPSLFAVSTP